MQCGIFSLLHEKEKVTKINASQLIFLPRQNHYIFLHMSTKILFLHFWIKRELKIQNEVGNKRMRQDHLDANSGFSTMI